jgi:hypothetical protein
LQQWPHAPDRADQLLALNLLRAKLGEPARAARELVALARAAHGNAALQLVAFHEAARLFTRLRESDNANSAWRDLEWAYRVASKSRAALPPDASAAAAEAHLALGDRTFEEFKHQRIEPPLARTLNRKLALLQQVKKRAEETVAMRQAEPAVCALAQLGEAQMLLAQAIAESAAPRALNVQERKLYRDALQEKAAPVLDEARSTLAGADAKARELGVSGSCSTRIAALLEKLGKKPARRSELTIARFPVAGTPPLVASDGRSAEPGYGRSSIGAAPVSKPDGKATRPSPAQLESRTGRDP